MIPPTQKLPEQASLGLVTLMWVLPFLIPHHQLPIPSFYGELTAFVLGMLAMLALWRKEVWQDFQLPRIVLLPFGLICILLLQMALGMVVFPQMALIAMQYLLWACLLMILGQRLRSVLGREAFAATLAWALVVGGCINSIMVILQYVGFKSLWLFPKISTQIFGNLGQPNHFADYMALAMGSLIYLLNKQHVSNRLFVTLSTVFLVMLALSGSRSSWLYILAFSVLALLKHAASPSDESRKLMRTCLMLLPAFALVQITLHWLLPLLGSESQVLPTQRFFQQVSGTSIRLRLWADAWQMFITHPWLGVGYGQYSWNSFLLAGTHAFSELPQPAEHTHNLPLHLLAELGLPAGALLIASTWHWIKGVAKKTCSFESWWMLALLALLGIHSLLEYPLWYSNFMGIAAILLGAGEPRMLRPDFSRVGRPALMAMLALGFYSAVALEHSYASLETVVNRAMSHTIKDRELASINNELLRLHKESMLTPYVELIYAISLPPSRERLDEKLIISQNALRFAPLSPVAYGYAELLALHGDRAAALDQLTLARKAYPNDFLQHQEKFTALGISPTH